MVSVRQAYTGFGKSFVNIQLAPDMRKNISKSAKKKIYDTSLAMLEAIQNRISKEGQTTSSKATRPSDPQLKLKNKIHISQQRLINRTIVAGAVLQRPWSFIH